MDYSEDVLDWQEFDILPPRLQMSGIDVRAESERDQLKLVTLLCGQESLSYIFSETACELFMFCVTLQSSRETWMLMFYF